MSKEWNKTELKTKYSDVCPDYSRLGKNLREALKQFLDVNEIDYLGVYCRVKEFESFYEKTQRKNYADPLKDIQDICGLRIVCYYPADLEQIAKMIEDEFEVIESLNKAELLDPDKFGYQSWHFIVKIEDEWASAPNYRDLCDLKVEIQVRTILMHAWADISHNLSYKKKEHIPTHLKRQLYRLSALFEIADEQFDSLRKQKDNYKEDLSETASRIQKFDVNLELNLDSLQALLDFYVPDRDKNIDRTTQLLDELFNYNDLKSDQIINMESLVKACEDHIQELPRLEKEHFKKAYLNEYDSLGEHKFVNKYGGRLNQVGALRMIFDVSYKDYQNLRNKFVSKVR